MTRPEALAWFIKLYESLVPQPAAQVSVGLVRAQGYLQDKVTRQEVEDCADYLTGDMNAIKAYQACKRELAKLGNLDNDRANYLSSRGTTSA